jgi:hypothetical protein
MEWVRSASGEAWYTSDESLSEITTMPMHRTSACRTSPSVSLLVKKADVIPYEVMAHALDQRPFDCSRQPDTP